MVLIKAEQERRKKDNEIMYIWQNFIDKEEITFKCVPGYEFYKKLLEKENDQISESGYLVSYL